MTRLVSRVDTPAGELRELRELVVALASRLDALERRGRKRPVALDEALVLAIARAVGDRNFNARELGRHRRVDSELAAAIRQAGVRGTRALGIRLGQLNGRTVSGVRLERLTRDNTGNVYRVHVTATLSPTL